MKICLVNWQWSDELQNIALDEKLSSARQKMSSARQKIIQSV